MDCYLGVVPCYELIVTILNMSQIDSAQECTPSTYLIVEGNKCTK